MTKLETLKQMIEYCRLPLTVELTANGEFTISDEFTTNDEFGTPTAKIIHIGGEDYTSYTLRYNHYEGKFETGTVAATAHFEDVAKEILQKIVADWRVAYFLEWQDVQDQIDDIEEWEIE